MTAPQDSGPGHGPGVTAHYARALVQTAERSGIELPAELVRRIRGADRVPIAWQDELWDAYCAGSTEPLAGLRLGHRVQIGHLDSVGMLLATCETLGEAFEELTAYAPVIGEGRFTVLRTAGRVRTDFVQHVTVRPRERTEAAVATLLHLAGWATGGRFRADGVWFSHAPLAPIAEYQAVLGVPAHFSASHNGLRCAPEQLALPLVQANPALHAHLRELVDRSLAAVGDGGVGGRVQQLVREHPEWGRDRVAAELDVSSRHLNRLLGEEGLSFKTVRERTLEELALRWLDLGDRVADVAVRLGYSDETAFTRAFRRWQGITPGQYRAGS